LAASADGITVRNDTGVSEGSEISVYYDPLIAKLVTHAPTRDAAIAAQADALDAFTVDGIRHNVPFLAAVMQHNRWRAGKLSTAFIAEEYPKGFHPVAPEGETLHVMAAVAAAIDHVLGERKRRISGQRPGQTVVRESTRVVRLGEREVELAIAREGEAHFVHFAVERKGQNKGHRLVSSWKPGDPLWSGSYDGHAIAVQVRAALNGFDLTHRGVEVRALAYTDSGKALRCPMPGVVRAIAVTEGQEVKAGETLAVVEAMKMENVLRAERDGVVKSIKARPGDSLAVDAVIMEFA
jgi:propionyl-CoA carboxylase alpha chain